MKGLTSVINAVADLGFIPIKRHKYYHKMWGQSKLNKRGWISVSSFHDVLLTRETKDGLL